MAMPVMAMGTELQRVPSMAMAVPAAATARPTQSGLTFQFVFMLFHNVRYAAAWAIRLNQTKPPVPFTWRRENNSGRLR